MIIIVVVVAQQPLYTECNYLIMSTHSGSLSAFQPVRHSLAVYRRWLQVPWQQLLQLFLVIKYQRVVCYCHSSRKYFSTTEWTIRNLRMRRIPVTFIRRRWCGNDGRWKYMPIGMVHKSWLETALQATRDIKWKLLFVTLSFSPFFTAPITDARGYLWAYC